MRSLEHGSDSATGGSGGTLDERAGGIVTRSPQHT